MVAVRRAPGRGRTADRPRRQTEVSPTVPEPGRLQPVERQTLSSVVMQRLMEHIKRGNLVAGDLLPSQHELARQLGVSRPVLREAMQGLASRGVVTVKPGSGCYVGASLDAADPESLLEAIIHDAALETLEARLVVEVELAGLAAERATTDDYRVLEELLAQLARATARHDDTAGITGEFHRALAWAGHNAVLFRMAELLSRPRAAQGFRIEHALPDMRSGELASHRRLYDAVRFGGPATARAEMRHHLEIAHGWEQQVARLRREQAFAGVET